MTYICDIENVNVLRNYFDMLSYFLKKFSWLCDAYILDFFTDTHWCKLPTSWQHIFNDMDLQEVYSLLDHKTNSFSKVLPLSLLAFRSTTFTLTWPRAAVTQEQLNECLGKLFSCLTQSNYGTLHDRNKTSEELKAFGHQEDLDHIFKKHVKPKKEHEIFRCAKVVDHVCCACDCSDVLDIGSGQGHLSRILGFKYGLNVTSVEGNGCHISGAKKFDTQTFENLKKNWIKQKLKESESAATSKLQSYNWHPPMHINYYISSTSDTSEVLNAIFPDSLNPRLTLLGLHTCGNLATTMLRLYVESPEICALISVGCCYMKLDSDGFPLSKMDQQFNLSYEAKEVSCHALEMYGMRIKERSESLKIHCFRATLEVLIRKYYPDLKRLGLRSVKHSSSMTFDEYARNALSKQNIEIPSEEYKSGIVMECLASWKQVVIFYSLRLMVAPLIESYIAVDRMLYLFEKGHPSCLIPVFDAKVSPRNYFLVSVKAT